MQIPEWWLEKPTYTLTLAEVDELEIIFSQQVQPAQSNWVEDLPVPKWVFLDWLCQAKGLLLHGSVNPNIAVFEPRDPDAKDDDAFSQQKAVFAASDGI